MVVSVVNASSRKGGKSAENEGFCRFGFTESGILRGMGGGSP
jgi:hypothetical protein